jgi:hypothetical protein
MRRRTAIVGLLVAVATALLVSAPSAAASNGADGALRAHAVASPWDILNKLMQVTKRAVARGKIVWSSDEIRTARRIGNQGRKAINWYCGQWVAYFKEWPYNARDTRAAVVLWAFSRPDYPAGRAYAYCTRLLYPPILWYGP